MKPEDRFSSPARLSATQMRAIQLVCSMARRKAPSASVSDTSILFFSSLQIIQAARHNEEECYMHIAYSLRQLDLIALHRRVGSSRHQKKVSVLHCWSTRDESPYAFQPCISVSGLAIASLWERLLVCYGITIFPI